MESELRDAVFNHFQEKTESEITDRTLDSFRITIYTLNPVSGVVWGDMGGEKEGMKKEITPSDSIVSEIQTMLDTIHSEYISILSLSEIIDYISIATSTGIVINIKYPLPLFERSIESLFYNSIPESSSDVQLFDLEYYMSSVVVTDIEFNTNRPELYPHIDVPVKHRSSYRMPVYPLPQTVEVTLQKLVQKQEESITVKDTAVMVDPFVVMIHVDPKDDTESFFELKFKIPWNHVVKNISV